MWDPPPPLAAAAPPLLFRSEERNLRCPRCQSTDTKFCYYNNYNLAQPRHFCRSCRRYWTKGGSLRNIPVGGGSRRNTKRVAPSPSSSSKRPLNPLATAGSSGEASDGGWVPPLPPPPPPAGGDFCEFSGQRRRRLGRRRRVARSRHLQSQLQLPVSP
ncbi:unnamed protein product [Spirodela intermedia]|uniref:Dof zinc finger protein n=1 Tax=Spirodela intermedia TaxID=51605 RepID=A0A7I8ISJ8_SPIIN|nr:unnamed protein product [Spirodela intermedia]CAA6660951.1 unnamed protein product [Spirodela intermedia]